MAEKTEMKAEYVTRAEFDALASRVRRHSKNWVNFFRRFASRAIMKGAQKLGEVPDEGRAPVIVLACLALISVFVFAATATDIPLDDWCKGQSGPTGGGGECRLVYDDSTDDARMEIDDITINDDLTCTDDATFNDVTASGTVQGEQLTSTDDASVTDRLTVSGDVKTDDVIENTSAHGVGIDSILCKDGKIYRDGTAASTAFAGLPFIYDPTAYYCWKFNDHEAGYVANVGTTNAAGQALPACRYSEVADAGAYLVTVVDQGPDNAESITVVDDWEGGVVAFLCNDAAADAISVQKNGESVMLEDGKKFWLYVKFAIEDVDQDDVFIGLASNGTDLYDTPANDRIGWENDNDGNLDFTVEGSNNEKSYDTAVDLVDAASGTNMTQCLMYYNGGTNIYSWVAANGATTWTASTNLMDGVDSAEFPSDEALSPGWALDAADTGSDNLYIDEIWVWSEL